MTDGLEDGSTKVSSCFARRKLGFSIAMAGLPLVVMHEGTSMVRPVRVL